MVAQNNELPNNMWFPIYAPTRLRRGQFLQHLTTRSETLVSLRDLHRCRDVNLNDACILNGPSFVNLTFPRRYEICGAITHLSEGNLASDFPSQHKYQIVGMPKKGRDKSSNFSREGIFFLVSSTRQVAMPRGTDENLTSLPFDFFNSSRLHIP